MIIYHRLEIRTTRFKSKFNDHSEIVAWSHNY